MRAADILGQRRAGLVNAPDPALLEQLEVAILPLRRRLAAG
jgi:hypothetical protein